MPNGHKLHLPYPTVPHPLQTCLSSTDYRTPSRHIPITAVVENKRRFLSAGACGRDKKKLLFETIDALVKYYKVRYGRSTVDTVRWINVRDHVRLLYYKLQYTGLMFGML